MAEIPGHFEGFDAELHDQENHGSILPETMLLRHDATYLFHKTLGF
jgi:hypothetical protein